MSEKIIETESVGVILHLDGLICVSRRHGKPEHWANGLWQVPCGSLEPGEKPRASGVREVKEETGIHLETEDLLFVPGLRHQKDNHVYHIFLFATCLLSSSQIEDREPNKATQWELRPAEELIAMPEGAFLPGLHNGFEFVRRHYFRTGLSLAERIGLPGEQQFISYPRAR